MIKKGKYRCPICKEVKKVKKVKNEEQKNCCQICTEYIKDFFIDC